MGVVLPTSIAVILAIAGLYFYGKSFITSNENVIYLLKASRTVSLQKKAGLILEPVIYTILGGICLILAGFFIPGVDLSSSVGCLFLASIVLVVAGFAADYARERSLDRGLKKLQNHSMSQSRLQEEKRGHISVSSKRGFIKLLLILASLALAIFWRVKYRD